MPYVFPNDAIAAMYFSGQLRLSLEAKGCGDAAVSESVFRTSIALMLLANAVKWPPVFFFWADRLSGMDARALADMSAPQLLEDWRAMLAFAHGQLWPEMHRRMNRVVVCAQTGLAKHAEDLGLIAVAKDGELALGPSG